VSSYRHNRRRRTLVTLALVILMLFFAFWYAYSYYRASGAPSAHPPVTCATSTAPTPRTVTLNVYNATDRNGLAARTATQLRQRGFTVATVSNDPLQKTVTGTAEVRYGRSGLAASRLVLAEVKGAKAVQDSRTDASVDLVLGAKFTALAPVPKAKPAPRTTSKPAAKPTSTPTSRPPTPTAARTTSAC
jgi:hypothetical protein